MSAKRLADAKTSRLLFWMKHGFHALQFFHNVLGPIHRKLIADRSLNLAKPFRISILAHFSHMLASGRRSKNSSSQKACHNARVQ
jgi:hypothetical protein